MRALEQLQLALSEVERTWWDSLPETDREHQARVQEVLTQLQYSPHDSVVLVAHTGLFVELASRHAAPHVREQQPRLTACSPRCSHVCPHCNPVCAQVREQQPGVLRALAAGQVAPCAVAWFALDFEQSASQPVTDVALLNDDLHAYGRGGERERRASWAERRASNFPPPVLADEGSPLNASPEGRGTSLV
jgi:hypothetical protein